MIRSLSLCDVCFCLFLWMTLSPLCLLWQRWLWTTFSFSSFLSLGRFGTAGILSASFCDCFFSVSSPLFSTFFDDSSCGCTGLRGIAADRVSAIIFISALGGTFLGERLSGSGVGFFTLSLMVITPAPLATSSIVFVYGLVVSSLCFNSAYLSALLIVARCTRPRLLLNVGLVIFRSDITHLSLVTSSALMTICWLLVLLESTHIFLSD